MSQRTPITVRLSAFEGPLDLLLYLIQSRELDISRVSITTVTDQYLAYVRLIQELNFDIASEFLVMAATLLHWKSRAILPENQKSEEEDEEGQLPSQEELVLQLLQHKRFLAAGEDLANLSYLGDDVFTRDNRRPPVEKVWKELDITQLSLSYQDSIKNARKRKTVLRKETVSISGKILQMGDRLKLGEITEMAKLFGPVADRPEVVVTFLASLEMARLKKLKVYQEETFQPIYVELVETLKDFNVDLATGFDAVENEVRKELENKDEVTPPQDVSPE